MILDHLNTKLVRYSDPHCKDFWLDVLVGQVNTSAGRYQLPIFNGTIVHLRRNTCPLFRRAVSDDIMSDSQHKPLDD